MPETTTIRRRLLIGIFTCRGVRMLKPGWEVKVNGGYLREGLTECPLLTRNINFSLINI